MTDVAIGLQRVYVSGRAASLYNVVTADGFLTRQLAILNVGNTAENQLFLGGGSVDATNTILQNIWTTSNKIIYDANNVLRNAPGLADKSYASGLIAFAS